MCAWWSTGAGIRSCGIIADPGPHDRAGDHHCRPADDKTEVQSPPRWRGHHRRGTDVPAAPGPRARPLDASAVRDLIRTKWWTLARWTVIVWLPVAAGLVLLPLRDHVRNTNIALLLALVTVGISVLGGLWPGTVAGLLTALSYDVVFTHPYGSLTVTDVDDVETVLLLMLIGAASGALVSWGRRQQREAARHEASARRLRRHAELASGSDTLGHLLQRSREELCDVLGARTCVYEPGPPGDDLAVLTHQGIVVPAGCASTRPWVALPIRRSGRVVGHFVVELPNESETGLQWPLEARQSAVALADHVGSVLEVLSPGGPPP
jgi:K+-sensing histidine kinase KdpD